MRQFFDPRAKDDPSYWRIHKQVWYQEYDKLDKYIAKKVMNYPEGREAKSLDKRVNLIVADKLQKF
tara:strand:+ start:308 stop:505 length:198 start_codon:yes stop_codon:yes gene_type:complete